MKRKQPKQSRPAAQPANPRTLAAAYQPLLPVHEYELLLRELDQPLPPAIRLNPLKCPPDLPQRMCQKYGWQMEPVLFCPDSYRVIVGNAPEVSAVLEHRLGMFYIQEAASMLPPELFDFSPGGGDIVLDMAASPGGKTTHLVSRLADSGLVLANDSSQGRIPALRIVLQNWGAVNTAITRFPGEKYGAWFPGVFDKVLLDAPCSMQGLRTAESHPVRPVTEKESLQLSRRQVALLSSAIRALKVGGEVVYSTCTLLPREDEAVVDAVLREFNGAVEIMDAQSVLPVPAPGLTSAPGSAFLSGMEKTIRLWPHRYHTAGFFACRLTKTAGIDSPADPPPARPMQQAGFEKMNHKETREFCEIFTNLFGYDLAAHLQHHRRVLVRHYEEIHLFPAVLLEMFTDLPLQSAGILLGQNTPAGFLPSHEWTLRFGSLCQHNLLHLDPDESALWIVGADLDQRDSQASEKGHYRIIINAEGYAIGLGKVTTASLKNLLPRRFL